MLTKAAVEHPNLVIYQQIVKAVKVKDSPSPNAASLLLLSLPDKRGSTSLFVAA